MGEFVTGHTTQELYRSLPNVDQVMGADELEGLLLAGIPRSVVLEAVRETLDAVRANIASGQVTEPYGVDDCVMGALPRIEAAMVPSLRPVVNATGIIVHTNLGRSVLPEAARAAVSAINEGYSNLEYSLDAGARGSRHDHVEALICELTGAEAAMAVNNNAAAVLLTLAGLAGGRVSVVSRGQLVEIGGSFRIPDVMAASGTQMIEVGTTNKTHLSDYRYAAEIAREEGSEVGLLFKAHTSNYKVSGFSSEVGLAELVALGAELGVAVAEDLGSGVLVGLEDFPVGAQSAAPVHFRLPHEPTVQESVAAGVDVVTFSGDKLLGGPQAGILCGRREAIARLKRHPLARAVRLDKMTLAALEATLRLYRDEERAVAEIPTLRMLAMSAEDCRAVAQDLALAIEGVLTAADCADDSHVQVVDDAAYAGGGSLPDVVLPSFAVALEIGGISAEELEEALRIRCEIPVIGRIKDDHYLLAARTLSAEDIEVIVAELEYLLQ